jgi:hypothetical protein
MTRGLTTLVMLFAFCAVGCSDGNTPNKPGELSDAGDADGTDAGEDACIPKTCAEVTPSCGVHDNGCGGELRCGECSCTASTLQEDCPAQPCMELVGCSDAGMCDYQPITCGGQACQGCADGSCGPDELRLCSAPDSCPAAFCDPSPQTADDGSVTYQNVCKEASEVHQSCGTCGMGAYECLDDGSYACVEPPLLDAGELRVSCDNSVRPTFVYLDPTYEGADADGTRQKPYTTIAAAVEAMQRVDAKALVIGGSPELEVPKVESGRADAPFYGFRITEGISMMGGYTGAPDFRRDTGERPTIYAPHASIALEASDIQAPTVISGIDFENSRDAIPDTSYGAVIRRSPGLELVDVEIVANEPPGAGEPATVADPMPAATKNFPPVPIQLTDRQIDEMLWIQNSSRSCFDRLANDELKPSDITDTSGYRHRTCPIYDERARQFYGSSVIARNGFFEDKVPVGGWHGGYAFWVDEASQDIVVPQFQSSQNAVSEDYVGGRHGWAPLYPNPGWFYDWSNPQFTPWATGGDWQKVSGAWQRVPAEDALPYTGTDRFAPAGNSGAGAELDADRLWKELGDGEYGEIGYGGPSGGAGAGGQGIRKEEILLEENFSCGGSRATHCFQGVPGEAGGGGGCGGLGGRGGAGGAWSVGILLDQSPETTFSDVRVHVADAAPGQYGSAGGQGAPGAAGAPSRQFEWTVCADPWKNLPEYTLTIASNPGGDGAAGQWGGHGGHGAAGSAVGVLCVETTLQDTSGLQLEVGEPGDGPSGTDPAAPADMPAPADPQPGQSLQTYQCDPTADP